MSTNWLPALYTSNLTIAGLQQKWHHSSNTMRTEENTQLLTDFVTSLFHISGLLIYYSIQQGGNIYYYYIYETILFLYSTTLRELNKRTNVILE